MKKLLSLGAVYWLIAMALLSGSKRSGSQDRDVNAAIRDQFVGAWRLAWLEEEGTDGNVHRADCTGIRIELKC